MSEHDKKSIDVFPTDKSSMANMPRSRYSDATNGRVETASRIMNRLLKLLVGVCIVLVAIFAVLHLGADRHPRAIAVNEPPIECEDTQEITSDCVNDDDTNTDALPELTPSSTQG
ncbi:hypothetical protein [Serratia quinivorans]|uniref:hypothetical protein n=1 Tax=Serratia quinivorans TaxID=137545 RepID=UPI0021B75AE3|nr:hypothetical protein [Serratia quinivorans]